MNKVKKLSLMVLLGALMSLAFSGTSMAASQKVKVKEGEDGKLYYYVDGELTKNKIGVKVNKKYYSVDKKGVATEITDTALGMASVQLTDLGISPKKAGKTSSLRKAFEWCYMNIENVGDIKSGKSDSWYAQYGFRKHRGDCNVYASTFYYMARALGYSSRNTKLMKGYILSAYDSNGKPVYGSHAWVTIKIDGKTKVFDPNFAYVYHNPEGAQYENSSSARSGFKMTYGKTGMYSYYKLTSKGKYREYK